MSMRGRVWILPVLLGLLAVLATGCGSTAGGASGRSGDAAGVVPADALAYVAVDLGSSQLTNAETILGKFPFKDKLLAELTSSLGKKGVDLTALLGSVGSELDIALLKVNGKECVVGFARPSDAKTFEQQLTAGAGATKPVYEQIAGWTVFSDTQAALDAVSKRTGNLSDDAAYRAAVATLPAAGDALARAFVAPSGLQALASSLGSAGGSAGSSALASAKWIAAAAIATGDGAVKLEVHAKGLPATAGPGSATLADQIPSGALVAASFDGSGLTKALGSSAASLGQASKALGIDLAGIVQALDGPVIAYVRSGVPLPEVTLAAKPADAAAAAKAVGGLLLKVSKSATTAPPTVVDGVTLDHVSLGAVDLYYGTFGGELVVTDSANAVSELKGSGDRLSADPTFQAAKSGSGLPDANDGFVYVNVKDALPLLEAVASLSGTKLPASLTANLKAVRSVVGYGSTAGDVQTLVLYLQTS